WNRALPASVFRLRVRLRLLALSTRKNKLSPSESRKLRRAMSPPLGSSSLITSAPRKARICVQAGPARLWVLSIMRMPERAFFMLALPDGKWLGGQCGMAASEPSIRGGSLHGAASGGSASAPLAKRRKKRQRAPCPCWLRASHAGRRAADAPPAAQAV